MEKPPASPQPISQVIDRMAHFLKLSAISMALMTISLFLAILIESRHLNDKVILNPEMSEVSTPNPK